MLHGEAKDQRANATASRSMHIVRAMWDQLKIQSSHASADSITSDAYSIAFYPKHIAELQNAQQQCQTRNSVRARNRLGEM